MKQPRKGDIIEYERGQYTYKKIVLKIIDDNIKKYIKDMELTRDSKANEKNNWWASGAYSACLDIKKCVEEELK